MANAVAEAKVTLEDATAWCAEFNAGYRGCVEDQLAQGGTAGGAKFRANDFKATANCQAGKLTAVDGRSYTYVGTWPDGGPGAGRAKFAGSMGEVGGRVFEQQGGPQVANGSTSTVRAAPRVKKSSATGTTPGTPRTRDDNRAIHKAVSEFRRRWRSLGRGAPAVSSTIVSLGRTYRLAAVTHT